MNVPASEVRPGDRVGGLLVTSAYTTGKKARTTSIHRGSAEPLILRPDETVEVER